MNADLLRLAGEALYGSRWQTPLAHDLDVSDRQMRRWAAGADAPDGVRSDIAALLRERKVTIDGVLKHFG